MTQLAIGALLGLLAPAEIPQGRQTIQVQGHRGARAQRPENTLAAFDYALEVGVDVLELDVAVSKDDRLVVHHDLFLNPEICRPRGGGVLEKRPVRSLTLEELKKIDCGSLVNPRFPGQTLKPGEAIPALEEVFALVKRSPHPAARTVELNVEAKRVPGLSELSPSPEAVAALLLAAVRAAGMTGRTVIQSFDHRTLEEVKRREPKVRIAALVSDTAPDFVAVARSIRAEIVSPHKDWIVREDVEALHRAGIRVIPWTANNQEDWQRLIALGVDGIITDDPAKLLEYLGRRSPSAGR